MSLSPSLPLLSSDRYETEIDSIDDDSVAHSSCFLLVLSLSVLSCILSIQFCPLHLSSPTKNKEQKIKAAALSSLVFLLLLLLLICYSSSSASPLFCLPYWSEINNHISSLLFSLFLLLEVDPLFIYFFFFLFRLTFEYFLFREVSCYQSVCTGLHTGKGEETGSKNNKKKKKQPGKVSVNKQTECWERID